MKTEFSKKLLIKIAAVTFIFSVVAFLDFSVTASQENKNIETIEFEKKIEELAEDSPFRDQRARIDSEAAFTQKTDDKGKENYQILLENNRRCFSLPQNFWVLILSAYVFLLIFNLTYRFENETKPRWEGEIFYTILALLAWYNFDECRTNVWFAQLVIILGVIIYSFYLRIFIDKIKKLQNNRKNQETQNSKQTRKA